MIPSSVLSRGVELTSSTLMSFTTGSVLTCSSSARGTASITGSNSTIDSGSTTGSLTVGSGSTETVSGSTETGSGSTEIGSDSTETSSGSAETGSISGIGISETASVSAGIISSETGSISITGKSEIFETLASDSTAAETTSSTICTSAAIS